MNKKEMELKEVDIITIPNKERILVHEPKLKARKRINDFLEIILILYLKKG